MGIPSYLRLIAKTAKVAVSDSNADRMDILCIDGNPDLYAAHSIVIGKCDPSMSYSKAQLDREIIDVVIQRYADEVARIKPRILYLAIDGVPPRAKMHLQRNRRFHKLVLKQVLSELHEKYNRALPVEWDTSQFTPGTVFMQKLHLALKKALKTQQFPCQVIYSSHLEPGEGEHKWNAYLRSLESSNICLRSNDGDLLVLGNQFPQHKVFVLTTLDEIKVFVNINEMQNTLIKKYKLSSFAKTDVMRDYVFFVSFCGNDFVKAFPFTSMRQYGAFDLIMKTYSKLINRFRKHFITSDAVVNKQFLIEFMKHLKNVEISSMKRKYNRYMSFTPKMTDALEDPLEDEKARFEHSYYFDPTHPDYESVFPMFKTINYAGDWRSAQDQYYRHFFGITKPWERTEICREYIKSILFCFHYYVDAVPSWEYCYPYRAPPFPSDVLFYLNKEKSNLFPNVKDDSVPYSPLELQMMVFPPSNKILPKKFSDLMKSDQLSAYYPDTFELDVLQGEKFIYSEPLLPDILNPIATAQIIGSMGVVPLTKSEQVRNTNVYTPEA